LVKYQNKSPKKTAEIL